MENLSTTYPLWDNKNEMSKKDDLKAELTKQGIAFEESATIPQLEALLPASDDDSEFTVGNPQILRPVELPLVIVPKEGVTWTPAQQEYVNTLNGYAYKNPAKWEQKKKQLLARLVEIKADPLKLGLYKGMAEGSEGNLSYKNNVIQK